MKLLLLIILFFAGTCYCTKNSDRVVKENMDMWYKSTFAINFVNMINLSNTLTTLYTSTGTVSGSSKAMFPTR